MNKEQLIEYRNKLSKLSIKESKERDIYLRKLSTGEIQGPPVGYASIDKPWLKYYSEEGIKKEIEYKKIYDELKDNCIKYNDIIAIEYYNKKITYKELLKNVDLVANSLIRDGVKEGDIVTICMPYLPETIYFVYALNKIGAIVNMVDPRINGELMTKYINNVNSNYIVILDKIEEKINSIIDNTNIKKVISVKPTNSMNNYLLKQLGKIKKTTFTDYESFIYKEDLKVKSTPFKKNELAVIEYTSGTSGEPKGVMLSNESFNILSQSHSESCKMNPGDKFLLIMPPFIAYGLIIGMHNMLGQGQHLLMIPNFTLDKAPEMLPKLVNKYHPNCIMGVPNFLQVLMNYKGDLSFLNSIIIGGDHLEPHIEKQAIEFLKDRGSNAQIYKGWGMTELASCGTFSKSGESNHIGSVGIPIKENNIKILPIKKSEQEDYDIDELELTYNEEGILFMNSNAMTLGYYNNESATKKVIYEDKSGTKWINTGDIFKVDENGRMFFNRREKRVVVRPDGHNIPTEQIENIASSFNEIENSIVIGTPCQKYEHGNYATLCITIKNKELSNLEKEKLLYDIEQKCKEQLQPRDRPKYYIILKEIPYTMNAKIDYNKLLIDTNNKILSNNIDEDSKEAFYIIDNNTISKTKVKRK